MENEPVISVKNIGKKYNITHQQGGYIALRDVLANILKSPFKFIEQKSKEVAGIAKREEFWALRDINFEVKKGEVVGIIGHNGAGKSTLLKILSKITPPTEGEIKINGRVGSLLEVGTGFHPELSGRENIFLNGAILGMTKKEIVKKFDEIIAFAGIEKFLDTPVKHYSSGMYVRLAFSVAAHMDPDILIIDEVLAVGDAEFQKKCLGKMNDITQKEGRTILFVSHNLSAIKSLCPKTILLEGGKIKKIDSTDIVLREYSNIVEQDGLLESGKVVRKGNGKVKIKEISLRKKDGSGTGHLITGQDAEIWVNYDVLDTNIKEMIVYFAIVSNLTGNRIVEFSNKNSKYRIDTTRKLLKINVKNLPLNPGIYRLDCYVENSNGESLDWIIGAKTIKVQSEENDFILKTGNPDQGDIFFSYNFH
jgi:lipopolysaccharide transport system ATP-binding protein